jgi:hypothetical protein
MIYFCTYFDKNYISKFLTLKASLDQYTSEYTFYILSLDDFVYDFFKKNNFKNVQLINLTDLEMAYPDLLAAKKNRSLIEYYFTLSPFLPIYIFKKLNVFEISYLDSDLYFFKNPSKFISESSDSSVVLIKQETNPIYGFYNVGWIFFNFNYNETREIVEQWGKQCLNSCSDIPNPAKNLYADQKYLDSWPQQLKKIKILHPEYSCLSPWDKNITIEANIESVISFHFHGLEIKNNYFVSGFSKYNKKISKKIIKNIYKPYLLQLLAIEKKYNLQNSSIRGVSLKGLRGALTKMRNLKAKIKQIIFKDFHLISIIKNLL